MSCTAEVEAAHGPRLGEAGWRRSSETSDQLSADALRRGTRIPSPAWTVRPIAVEARGAVPEASAGWPRYGQPPWSPACGSSCPPAFPRGRTARPRPAGRTNCFRSGCFAGTTTTSRSWRSGQGRSSPGCRGVAAVDADVGGAVGHGADDDRARSASSRATWIRGCDFRRPAEVAGRVCWTIAELLAKTLRLPRTPCAYSADFAVHLGEVAHQHARVMQESVTGGRGPKSGMVTAEELHLGGLLEIGDSLADRGGRDVLALSRLGDALRPPPPRRRASGSAGRCSHPSLSSTLMYSAGHRSGLDARQPLGLGPEAPGRRVVLRLGRGCVRGILVEIETALAGHLR